MAAMNAVLVSSFFGSLKSALTGRSFSPDSVKAAAKDELAALIVDVRTPSEYSGGHVPSAVNVPVDRVGAGIRAHAKDKTAAIFVYCASGGRSAAAASTLSELGYTDVRDMGGIGNWTGQLVR